MKYVFILTLLVVAAAAGLWLTAVVVRWNDDMTQTVRIVPGERVFPMPAGVVPGGGELVIPKGLRDVAARQGNPVKSAPAPVGIGRAQYEAVYAPRHGPDPRGGAHGPGAN